MTDEPLFHEGYPPEHRPDWIALGSEDALDPERPIIDAHHHLFEFEGTARYSLDDFAADLDCGHNVVGSLFIEALVGYRESGPEEFRPVGEAAQIADWMDTDNPAAKVLRGMLGSADLTSPLIGEVLDAFVEEGRGAMKGIRDRPTYSEDPGFRRGGRPGLMLTDEYIRGSKALAERGLVHDNWLYLEQVPEYIQLIEQVPEGTFVLDHLGGILGFGIFQGRREELLEEWRTVITRYAALPNTVLKLGGVGMRISGLGYENGSRPASSDDLVRDWGETLRFALETMGPQRCMFESNFPLDRSAFTYGTLWNAYKKITADLTESEKNAVFHDTASRIYGI